MGRWVSGLEHVLSLGGIWGRGLFGFVLLCCAVLVGAEGLGSLVPRSSPGTYGV